MRLLILTQYYPPETGAPQNRLSDLARRLAGSGHPVTVLTAMPNYPKGEIFESYRGTWRCEEEVDGTRVVRTWIYAARGRAIVPRLLNYFSFVLTSLLCGAGRVGRQDVVLVESPPLFLGISGYLLSRLLGARLVFNVSDLWPASAVSLGVVRNRLLIGLSEWLELFLYGSARLVTGQTEGILSDIRRRRPSARLYLFPNGVDLESFRPRKTGVLRRSLGLEGAFVVGYAGLHGLAQGLGTVLRAAERLVGTPGITFCFWGDGPEKESLVRAAGDRGLANVRFFPPRPAAEMPEVLASFDAALVPLKRNDLFRGARPSKMFEAMAAGVPLILSVDGEARGLVEEAGAGLCVEPESSGALAEAVLALQRDPEGRQRMGRNGRAFVTGRFDRAGIAVRLEGELLQSCGFVVK